MQDQATNLRSLVSQIASAEVSHSRAYRIVLTGAKGGVGTTTMAINLAIALRKHAPRVLLIDAHPTRGDVATICRLSTPQSNHVAEYDLEDVLQSRREWLQTTVTGPADIQVVPRFGASSLPTASGYGASYQSGGQLGYQLARKLDSVCRVFDFVVIDAGSCPLAAETICPAADQAIVVTTSDPVSITDAYSLIKSLQHSQSAANVHGLINRYLDVTVANETGNRLRGSCQRFLNIPLEMLPPVPDDGLVTASQGNGRMVTCAFPASPAAMAISAIAEELVGNQQKSQHLNSLVTA